MVRAQKHRHTSIQEMWLKSQVDICNQYFFTQNGPFLTGANQDANYLKDFAVALVNDRRFEFHKPA